MSSMPIPPELRNNFLSDPFIDRSSLVNPASIDVRCYLCKTNVRVVFISMGGHLIADSMMWDTHRETCPMIMQYRVHHQNRKTLAVVKKAEEELVNEFVNKDDALRRLGENSSGTSGCVLPSAGTLLQNVDFVHQVRENQPRFPPHPFM
ncbi:hypothetical protein VNI00_009257 [Paramarasmius palmivorus]|uniref:Uncharacterized protein n=1 Tax=Paramarasmius palmivorus TaxID=297713 RepID=A0AAW0CU19_9AGAR